MSRQAEVRKITFVQTWEARMSQAKTQQLAANQAVADVKANWDGYAALASADADFGETATQFGVDSAAHWNEIKPGMATSLDILAGGMGMTRQDLLDELAAL